MNGLSDFNGSLNLWFFVVLGIVILFFIISMLIFLFYIINRQKGRTNKIIIDNDYIESIINSLGGIPNIKKVEIENTRLKFELNDVENADLDMLNEIASNGVFVSANKIKVLFKYESFKIKEAIENKIK